MTLEEYEAEIDRLIQAAENEPNKMVCGPLHEDGYFTDIRPQREVNRELLARLSQEIRRILWHDRRRAWSIAAKADAFVGGHRLPRWEASHSECSGWAPAID